MRLKDTDVMQRGDIVHTESGNTMVVKGYAGHQVQDLLSYNYVERPEPKVLLLAALHTAKERKALSHWHILVLGLLHIVSGITMVTTLGYIWPEWCINYIDKCLSRFLEGL
ncbi:MAG: hypothetical protein Q8M94_01545 [Ignavibacteria bacterium]|nr:hypothetical protein [Ignavibacteria bacterium]